MTWQPFRLQVPQQCPIDISELIKDCMKLEPDERPSARDIFDRLKVTSCLAIAHMVFVTLKTSCTCSSSTVCCDRLALVRGSALRRSQKPRAPLQQAGVAVLTIQCSVCSRWRLCCPSRYPRVHARGLTACV